MSADWNKNPKENLLNANKQWRIYKTLFTLVLTLPFVLIVMLYTIIYELIYPRPKCTKIEGPQKTILITGGKMLKSSLFARWFGEAGYRVILVETHKYWCCGSRFS